MNRQYNLKRSPIGLVLLTVVLPADPDKAKSLLDQLKMFLAFFSRLRSSQLHLYILTNYKSIDVILNGSGLPQDSYSIDLISKKELVFTHGREGEPFELAFAKLDAVVRSEKILSLQSTIKAVVVTDVDAIITNAGPIVDTCLSTHSMTAINYRSEQVTSDQFDVAMQLISANSKWRNIDGKQYIPSKAWINSGFMIIKKEFVLDLIESHDLSERSENMTKNYQYIKSNCSNHYGDELLFSSLFSDVLGEPISPNSSKLAQLIWTCHTEANTFRLLNPFSPPAHIHVPAVKWSPLDLKLLTRLASKRFGIFRSTLLINDRSIKAHCSGNRVVKYLRAMSYCLPLKKSKS